MATAKRKHRTPKKRHNVVVIGKRKTRRVGSTGIGRTHHRAPRKSRRVSGVNTNTVMHIAVIGAGMVGGAMLTHMAIRKIEHHITDKYPQAGKFMGALEILAGGLLLVKSKKPLVQGVAMGIMAGGVHTIMHQFKMGTHSPAIAGSDDYQQVRIPISGDLTNLIAGSMEGFDTSQTSYVAGNQSDIYRTYLLAGIDGTEDFLSGREEENYLDPKGYNF